MNETKSFDVWFLRDNTVYKEVPYHVVLDWVQQAKLGPGDMLKPSSSETWVKVSEQTLIEPFVPQPEPTRVGDAAEALEPIELDFNWKKRHDDDDEDVDMIPLIDISLVLLIFFMMTTTVAAISRIAVPNMANAVKIDTDADILRVDVDLVNGKAVYGLAKGIAAPKGDNADLADEAALNERLEVVLAEYTIPPKVRIAAHGELEYHQVDRIMNLLDRLRNQGKIAQYHIEVNERPAQ